MILEVQSEFSNRQPIRAARTVSQDAIDLGEYFYRSAYPTDTDPSAANSAGPANNLVDQGRGANKGTDLVGTQGRGYYAIDRRWGTQMFPFFCNLTTTLTRAGLTTLNVEFRCTNNAPQESATAAYSNNNEGILVATGAIPATATNTIAAGAQIPWPAMPRFVTRRYLFLVFELVGGSANPAAGNISAGFTVGVPSQ